MPTRRLLYPHVPQAHVPHPHMPHPHVDLDEHPWRALPLTLGTIVVLAALLMVACFAIAKALVGQAY